MLFFIIFIKNKSLNIIFYILLIFCFSLFKNLYADSQLENIHITNTNNMVNSILDVIETAPNDNNKVWIKGSVVVGEQIGNNNNYMFDNTSTYSVFQAGIYLIKLTDADNNKQFFLSLSGGTTIGELDNAFNNQTYIGYDAVLQEQFFINDYFFTFAQIYLTEYYKDDLLTGADSTYNEMFYNNRFGKHINYQYAVFTPEIFYTMGNVINDSTNEKFANQEYGVRVSLSMKGKFAPYIFFEDSQNKQAIYNNDTLDNNITTWSLGINYIETRAVFNLNYSYEKYTDGSYTEGQLYAGLRYNI